MKKIFKIADVRSILDKLGREEITYSRMVEMLNEHASRELSKSDVLDIFPPVIYLERVNRVEVIDQSGRAYVNWKPTNKTEISLQDHSRTLKVFIYD